MSDLTSLIERIEAATEGSRELDVAVIMALYPGAGPYAPYCQGDEPIFWNDPYRKMRCPKVSTSIDAALTLLPEGFEFEFTNLYGVAAVGMGINTESPCYARREDGNITLALLAAILRARQTEGRHDES